MRPARKARGGRIPGVCNRRATPRPGMQVRPNVTGLRRRNTKSIDRLPGSEPARTGASGISAVIRGISARRWSRRCSVDPYRSGARARPPRGHPTWHSNAHLVRAGNTGCLGDGQDRGEAPADDDLRNDHALLSETAAVNIDVLIGSGRIISCRYMSRARMKDRALPAPVARQRNKRRSRH